MSERNDKIETLRRVYRDGVQTLDDMLLSACGEHPSGKVWWTEEYLLECAALFSRRQGTVITTGDVWRALGRLCNAGRLRRAENGDGQTIYGAPGQRFIPPRSQTIMRPYLKMYLDNDRAAIATNILDERELVYHAATALGDTIAARDIGATEAATLYLPLIVDLCCKLRGYKAPLVDEERVLFAGKVQPSEQSLAATTGASNGADDRDDAALAEVADG